MGEGLGRENENSRMAPGLPVWVARKLAVIPPETEMAGNEPGQNGKGRGWT